MEKKLTLFFVHGNSSSSKVYDSIVKDETILGNKVVVDLPGYGDNNLEKYTEKDFSIKKYREFLLQEIGKIDGEIILFGNSLGGHLVIEIAPKVQNLKALVIFGTPVLKKPLNIQEGFCDIPALSTFFTETPTEEQIISASKIAVHQKKCAKLIENDFKKSNPKVRSAIVKNIENEAFLDEYTIFTNLEISTYIIAGKYDPTVRFAYLEMLQETAKKCKLICLEDCGHYTSLEQPIKFSIIVRQIIKEVY